MTFFLDAECIMVYRTQSQIRFRKTGDSSRQQQLGVDSLKCIMFGGCTSTCQNPYMNVRCRGKCTVLGAKTAIENIRATLYYVIVLGPSLSW